MKRLVVFSLVAIFALSLASKSAAQNRDIGVLIKAGGSFATVDLNGTWNLYYLEFDQLNNMYWGHGTIVLDALGNATGGTFTMSNGTAGLFTGGLLTLSSQGKVGGTFTTSTGLTITIQDGKMDHGKTFVAIVAVNNGAYPRNFAYLVKQGGPFGASDAQGTWDILDLDFDELDNMLWLYGIIDVDASNTVTGATYAMSNGSSGTLTDGTVISDPFGKISGSIDFSSGVTVTIEDGKLDQSKTFGALVARNISPLPRNFGFLVKEGGSFADADLRGSWHWYFMKFDEAEVMYWGYGSIAFDAIGLVTSGSYTLSNGTGITITGGNFNLDPAGKLGVTATTSTNLTLTIRGGKMDQGKTIVGFVDKSTLSLLGDGGGGCFISTAAYGSP